MKFNFVTQRHRFEQGIVRFILVSLVIIPAINGLLPANPTEKAPQERPIRVKEMHVTSKIRYRYCRTQIVSRVVNTDPFIAQEVNFFMRIPRNAFISNFTLETGGSLYNSSVVKREEATAIYETGKDYNNTVALIETDSDSKVFNVSLNIEANGDVTFVAIYEEQIVRENGHYAYRIYMHPQQMKNVEDFKLEIDMKEFYPFSYINIPNLNTGKVLELNELVNISVDGSNARLDWQPRKNRTYFEKLVSEGALGQFSILYDLERNKKPGQILLRNGYFVHTFNAQDLPILPKHVIFVLDISASMMGTRLRQLQTAMKNIFDDLRADDYFNIITFSSQVQNWSPFSGKCANEIIPFSHDFKNMAIDFIDNLEVHGSTNINGALEEALRLSRKFRDMQLKSCILPKEYDKYMNSNLTSMILFLTDGEPTSGFIYRPQILENIKNRNKNQIPIFSLAFGAEADFNFVQKLSLQNHGFSRRVYEGIDSDVQLQKFYDEISSPVLTNVTFLYTSPVYKIDRITFYKFSMLNKDSEIQISGAISPMYETFDFERKGNSSVEGDNNSTIPVADVFKVYTPKVIDSSIICVCDFCDGDKEEFISADTVYNPSNECQDGEDYFMERRWAYISIMNLIDLQKAAENATIKEKIVNMSLQYQFVTPYTSLVVVKPNRNDNKETSSSTINVDAEIDDPLEKYKNSAAFYEKAPTTRRPRKAVTLLSASIQNYAPGPTSPQFENPSAPSDNKIKLSRGFSFFKWPTSVIKNHDSTGNRYNLTDILWLESHKSILVTTENSSDVYNLYQHHQENISYQNCKVPGKRPGRCKHLKDCVVKEILTDFNLFLSSYFCPITPSGQSGKYIGTCCPRTETTRRM